MKQKVIRHYQKLSLVKKLLIPMIISVLFGMVLTVVIVKKVGEINKQTSIVHYELTPALECSVNNSMLLKKVSNNFTFALIGEEEEMLSDMDDAKNMIKNLKEMMNNRYINTSAIYHSLQAFEDYFNESTEYALGVIRGNISEDLEKKKELILNKHNHVEKQFKKLHDDIAQKILFTTNQIKAISQEVIFITIAYIIILPIILFYISYIIYQDVVKRLHKINHSLDKLGMQKSMLQDTDAITELSQNIEQAIEAYSIIDMQRKELYKVNQKVQNSIDYAALMQKSILPKEDVLNSYTKQNMICWQPKDTVGGDIYFVDELESKEEVIIMVIDGVGHGVSGAFLTILVKAIQTQIIAKINKKKIQPSPATMLSYFNRTIKEMLQQDENSESNSGFDGSILYYNRKIKECKYAGAKSPLYMVDGDHLEVIKGDRASVGFIRTDADQTYSEYDIPIKEGAKYYMLTDGMVDQEGSNNRRYGKTRFKNLILENHDKVFFEQKATMLNDLEIFKENNEQSDDITILGMQFT